MRLWISEYFDGDYGASHNPRIAIDLDPIAEVLVAAVEEAPDLVDGSLLRLDLAAIPITC